MIRQAISCDICGTEKRQTNHWFVAYEQSGELRLSGFASRRRGRAGSKHLCGQTCLHKLVDEFMATSIAARSRPAMDEVCTDAPIASDTSLISGAAQDEAASSARLITPAPRALPLRALRAQPEVVAMPPRLVVDDSPPAIDDLPDYSSPSRRAEAWQRERERESRAATPSGSGARQRSLAHRGG